jgi:hypothetical protein
MKATCKQKKNQGGEGREGEAEKMREGENEKIDCLDGIIEIIEIRTAIHIRAFKFVDFNGDETQLFLSLHALDSHRDLSLITLFL